MMALEQLPPKGVKREQAILELGKDEANGELLLQLVNTEKGKCKTAAQKALAQLEYAPTVPLWAKLVKGKWMGSHIMSDACSDCVSEQIAPVILKTLSQLLDEGDTTPPEIEQLNLCFHLMLGKASPKMLEVYRFLAENIQRIAQMKRAPVYSEDDCTSWWITDGLRIWDTTPKEKEKIPAVVLTASLIRNPDEWLQALADELNERYGGSWLIFEDGFHVTKDNSLNLTGRHRLTGKAAVFLKNGAYLEGAWNRNCTRQGPDDSKPVPLQEIPIHQDRFTEWSPEVLDFTWEPEKQRLSITAIDGVGYCEINFSCEELWFCWNELPEDAWFQDWPKEVKQ